jgi:hypothetical protein
MRRRRRIMTVAVATMTVWMLFTGTALAHFCNVANRSEQGNRSAAKSQAWISIEQILVEDGLCADGIAHFDEVFLAPRGASTSTLLHERALLAGPHAFTEKVRNGKGIDHLFTSDADFAAVGQAFGEAFALCIGDE